MMKIIFNPILITILFINFTANAQQRAALHSNGTTTIYSSANPFVDAYNASVDGDTIYLSGGGFTSPININKGLTIIGAGFHPDSTSATYPTFFSTTNIYLGGNADNLHIEGLEFINLLKSSSNQVNNLTIKRCKISSLTFSYDGAPVVYSVNLGLLENIITSLVNLSGINNSVVSNNILQGQLNDSYNNSIQNNIFLYPTQFGGCQNNVYKNNIFSNTNGVILTTSNGNIFEKNVFTTANPNFDLGAIDNNNYKSVDLTTLYVNQTGHTFNYTHNYHLKPAAVSTYIGSDGTQVGIYGGIFPYKAGAVPLNPHIQFKNISSQTNNNGDLNIQLKVNAQTN